MVGWVRKVGNRGADAKHNHGAEIVIPGKICRVWARVATARHPQASKETEVLPNGWTTASGSFFSVVPVFGSWRPPYRADTKTVSSSGQRENGAGIQNENFGRNARIPP
jgi:hypothetical protein